MSDYLISAESLLILFLLQAMFVYLGSCIKIHVPIKVYRACFATEAILLAAYIVFRFVVGTLPESLFAVIVGYVAYYMIIWFSYGSLRHWTIDPKKEYTFIPQRVHEFGNNVCAVGGYIEEDGLKMYVYVDDNELCLSAKKDVPVKVKYRKWKNFAAYFNVAE